MLTLRTANISLLVMLAAVWLGHNLWPVLPWWIMLFPPILYVAALVWGAINIRSNFYIPALCAARTNEKVIAITFDDGPLLKHTPEILDILQQERVPAAFFCIGNRIEGNETLLRRIDTEGHVIGNHSFSHHFWFDMFGSGKMLAELKQMDDVVESVTTRRPRLFRPPYGVTNPNLAKAIIKGGYLPIGWNIRSLDTVAKDKDQLLERIKKGIKPGAVLLLHDSMEVTVQALPLLLQHLKKEGYRIERIDKLLNIPAYA
ncbi:polysaccharide deacetylase family protein [Chitinophaga sp. S165]|uniref:polysaccharide deacetylase family protein n=1 Tax=Chitinophaga sp. S165 TaxID=2135462 RepID=UPI000D719E7E|nr:polysaccharide deacetylase family protein [Chitinophaga sp. S165]PWV50705.1 peptidoglycan/xylan/chitin deacetylase (PgdA/CDA1 family) [Chitinophaga sp. S165]